MSRLYNNLKHRFLSFILAFFLSILFSEYTSQFLYANYRGWMIWRDITGSDPNFITSIIQKISWALLFFSSFFMLWKLDSFFIPYPEKEPHKEKEQDLKANTNNEENHSETNTKDKEDSTDSEDEPIAEDETFEPEEEQELIQDEFKFNFTDLKYAETLGLKEPFSLKDIKPSYRKIIAQYHPDRVAAMGEEIQEVAEKKAKEINRAYDYFQKKYNLS